MTSFLEYGTPLHTAIRTGQLEPIKTSLDQKDSINDELLHLAASFGQVEVARLLITRYSCPVDCRNKKKQTPLHIACGKGHLTMVRMLITEYQAKVMLRDDNNDTPLHEAAWCGQTEIVNCLISEFNCNPNSKGMENKTILHLACRQGHTELVEALLTQHKLEAELLSTDNDGNVPLHDAAWGGSETILRPLITKYKCPVESRNHSKQTPLHLACSGGHLRIVNMLITEYKADLNARDKDADTPLYKATLFGQSKVVLCLINEFSCNLDRKGIDEKTILYHACRQGHTELIKTLSTQYGPDLLSVSDENGNTPLHFAALGGNERVAKLLITKYNCPLSCENNDKETPLDIACNKGHLRLVRLIVIEHKADLIHSTLHIVGWQGQIVAMNSLIKKLNNNPHIKDFDRNHSVPSGQKYTKEIYEPAPWLKAKFKNSQVPDSSNSTQLQDQSPLSHTNKRAALLFTKYDSKTLSSIIRIFVIECNAESERDGDECASIILYEGVWYGNTEILIKEFYSPLTIEVLDGRTMLNLAIQQGYIELIKPLLTQYSIDPLSADNNGNTLLHYAAWAGREDIVELFITKYNCPVNVPNNNNQTPLHLACSAGDISIVRMLVTEHKADLHIQDKDNDTPLHIAAWCGHTKVVKSLIDEFSCNPNTKGHDGRTILHHACQQGHVELVETLLTVYNLDPSCVADNGNTSLHLAAWGGSKEVIEVLITKYHCVVDSANDVNETPLHLACAGGHLKVVRMLINVHGANLHGRDSNNDTPLHKAAIYGQFDVIICLTNELGCNQDAKGHEGRTILHHACHQGHMELVEILMKYYKLDPLSVDDNGNTSLHMAAMSGREGIVNTLIAKCDNRIIDCRNKSNQSPFDIACNNGHFNIVKMFVTRVAKHPPHGDTLLHIAASHGQSNTINYLVDKFSYSPSMKGRDGMTILHSACHRGHIELTEILLTQYKLRVLSRDNNENTPLHYAALGDQENVVELLITKYGCPVDCQNSSKESPLHLACSNGHLAVVRMLVTEHNADMNACDKSSDTPFHKAAWYGHTDVITYLIDQFGCDPYIKGASGATILHHACYQGHAKLITTLVSFYKLDPLSVDDNGNTPLHHAALGDKAYAAKVFITEGDCPVDCRNKNNQTPLHLACASGNLNVVRILVSECKADLNTRDESGDTPLHTAALYGQPHIINCLINEFKVNPNTKGNQGRTVLHHACSQEHIELAEIFLTVFKLDPLSTDANENTPLHIVAMHGRVKVAKLLITKYGCPVDYRNSSKQTPLHLACSNGHLDMVSVLVSEYNADLNTHDGNNDTPLHRAAFCGHAHIIDCVINELSYDPNTRGSKGRTILHHACHQGHVELVETLLTDHKLDPLSGDDDGNTPLHLAAMDGRETVAKLLVTEYDYPVDHRNDIKQSPLHLACSNGHIHVVRTLLTECNADLYIRDVSNSTPLHTAVFRGQIDILDCIIDEFNCSIDVKGTNGSSVLHLACQQGHLDLVERLVTVYKLDPLISDDDGNIPLHYAALGGKNEVAKLLITKYSSPVNHPNNDNETPLHLACAKGHLTFIQIFVTEHKPDINACDINNHTPLQRAALSGQAEMVFYLISEFNCDHKVTGAQGRNLLHFACLNDHDVLARQLIDHDSFHLSLISADSGGNSPLHISTMYGQNKCVHMLLHIYHAPLYLRNNSGKSAFEVAKDVVTKEIIDTYLKEEHNKIQYDYKEVQSLSKKKYSGSQRLTRVFVLGNVQSGKSTLIESLKRQRFFSSFNQVSEDTVPPHTSGIIPSEYCHKTIGRVLYYDFAGDPEYYSSHSAIMSSVMHSEQGTNVCLVLVNFHKDAKYIIEEIGYWLSFISYHCIKKEEKCKVLTIGSHVDLITESEAKRKSALISEFTEKYLSHASNDSIEVVKSKSDLTINCCKPRSSTCVHSALNQIVKRAATFQLSVEAAILLGLLEKDFKNVVTCKIQTLLTHIMETGVYLPNTADSLYLKVIELHAVGLLMVIESKNSKLEDYLLLLNVPKLTNEVHKLLFSKDSAKKFISSTDLDPYSASMGILPQTYLKDILPEYITTDCLVQLQYCQEFSHAEVKFDYSVIPTDDSSALRLLYFPALCETERKNSIKTPDNYDYSIGWYVKCCGKFDYLPTRFLHVLLLRLAHSFALPAACAQPSTPSMDPEGDVIATVQLYNRRCTMWKNGIQWLMEEGVECYVENVNNSKGIVVIAKSKEARKFVCTEMLFQIIREIHQAKEEFCDSVTLQEYLMDSNDPALFNDEDKLYLISDPHFAQVLSKGDPLNVIVSINGKNPLDAEKVLHLAKYIHWDAEKKTIVITYTPPKMNTVNIKLSQKDQTVMFLELKMQSTKWRDIGIYLGFTVSELDNIQARPLLMSDAPNSWFNEMLAEWLQWAPGDGRGSTKYATLEGLRDALDKTGLEGTATVSKMCHQIFLDCLTNDSQEWRKIGEYLEFCPGELDNIQKRSRDELLRLSTMLAEWLQWAPGDERGSTKCATLEGLRDALNKAGLSDTAQSIMTLGLN